MEERIGKINASIVRDLGLPEGETEDLVAMFEKCGRISGDERTVAISMTNSGFKSLRYWELLCERWDITIADLAENDWRIVLQEVLGWALPGSSNNGEILKWLHAKFVLPREALASRSHYAIYYAVHYGSIEAVRWLVKNFNIDLDDSWDYFEYLKATLTPSPQTSLMIEYDRYTTMFNIRAIKRILDIR